jgi:glutamate N-acetyltransferase/amino-acid N-acetyltransferase
MVLALANGAAGVAPGDEGLARLAEGLRAALLSLALAMVADGEGATKAVKLTVSGARDADQAERVARAVADSPLVKTAFYGRDANWGRIVQAAGQALGGPGAAALDLEVAYDGLAVVSGGQPAALGEGAQERLADIMTQAEIDLTLDLKAGGGAATVYFCDLTHAYVTLNAEYTT